MKNVCNAKIKSSKEHFIVILARIVSITISMVFKQFSTQKFIRIHHHHHHHHHHEKLAHCYRKVHFPSDCDDGMVQENNIVDMLKTNKRIEVETLHILRVCKIQLTQKLKSTDHAQWLDFVEWSSEQQQVDADFSNGIVKRLFLSAAAFMETCIYPINTLLCTLHESIKHEN
uniref:Uncharacterized protein n=1 Tax=Glossina pallidipes TaxID=7398 RepID=A0A1A9ZE43_GLOPL